MTDLTEENLSLEKLKIVNLIGVNLNDAYLYKTKFNAVNLSDANLSKADIKEAELIGTNLSGANLSKADLTWANLIGAELIDDIIYTILSGVNLNEAYLNEAFLTGANLIGANIIKAEIKKADLIEANLTGANLTDANLNGTILINTVLIRTNFKKADLTDCNIYGVSAWDLKVDENTIQTDLIITDPFRIDESIIRVDNLEVAQFIYVLINNEKIREVIDTITSKVVLILGRFSDERKVVLDAIREKLRGYNYVPVLFDFKKPHSRDGLETVSTLAHMARFVFIDITEAKSVPAELQLIIPNLTLVPVQPIIQIPFEEYGTFEHYDMYPWVLKIHEYKDKNDLLKSIDEIINTIENRKRVLEEKKKELEEN